MILLEYSKRYERARGAIQCALVSQDQPKAWRGLETVLKARLTPYERACLLSSIAGANDPSLLVEVLETVVPARLVGAPLPTFIDIEADAGWWADLATVPELKAYLSACFLRLPEHDKMEFLTTPMRGIDT